ncbi:hypothetical protein NX059_011779 [Plenodomus lindquistii]|nr:hypothetical protein NX059_011779 [Plenodomus lindquistii]
MPSLLDLPDEILLHVIANIDLHRESRILGHDPDFSSISESGYLTIPSRKGCRPLINLALTCKRFWPLVAEQIVFAPVLTNSYPDPCAEGSLSDNCIRIFALLHILLAHQERRRHVKQLRLTITPIPEDVAPDWTPPPALIEQIHALIESLEIPPSLKNELRDHARHAFETLVSILLLLVPQLDRLCIARPLGYWITSEPARPCCLLRKLPSHTLGYLKFEKFFLADLDHVIRCVKTNTLDLSVVHGWPHSETAFATPTSFAPLASGGRSSESPSRLRNLRLDFRAEPVGPWTHNTRNYIVDLLQKFNHLVSLDFYAEPTENKNPYRSVRAFPHYQANIQNYPDGSSQLPADVSDDHWDRTLYDSRTEVTDYQSLVDSIIHLRPTLETLRLPGGFWTLPGGVRKPLPRFDKFMQLQKLVLPQAAIIAIRLDNMRFDEVAGDFDLSPKTALPPNLRHLEVFDVDASFLQSVWLLDFFGAQLARKQWPAFRHFEIRMGYTVDDELLKMLIARRAPSYRTFCTLAQTAPFSITVRRDDDVPMLWRGQD